MVRNVIQGTHGADEHRTPHDIRVAEYRLEHPATRSFWGGAVRLGRADTNAGRYRLERADMEETPVNDTSMRMKRAPFAANLAVSRCGFLALVPGLYFDDVNHLLRRCSRVDTVRGKEPVGLHPCQMIME